jgi:hypothetical protein
MEADWSVEIGSDSPVIDGTWEGFVNLRGSPDAIESVIEATKCPELREALLALNNKVSSAFTTKCDVWSLTEKEIDPDEFEARQEDARVGFASYIDFLECNSAELPSFEFQEQRARMIAADLARIDLRQGRADIVVHSAVVNENEGYGLTLYAAGCGCDKASALAAWRMVLQALVAVTIAVAAHTPYPRASSSIG